MFSDDILYKLNFLFHIAEHRKQVDYNDNDISYICSV